MVSSWWPGGRRGAALEIIAGDSRSSLSPATTPPPASRHQLCLLQFCTFHVLKFRSSADSTTLLESVGPCIGRGVGRLAGPHGVVRSRARRVEWRAVGPGATLYILYNTEQISL